MNKGWFPKFRPIVSYFFRASRQPYNLYQSTMKTLKVREEIRRTIRVLVFLPPFVALKALSPKEEATKQQVITKADELFDEVRYKDLYEFLLNENDFGDPEVLWRVARAIFKHSPSATNDKEKLAMLEQALEATSKALEINETCWAAHKWYAILLDHVWRLKSTKGRITRSLETRKHIERAIELNPKDSTNYYMLGEWCYSFADLPWYQRQTASVIFATPPTSTYEEALSYYEKAEQNDPGFYSMNLLMMGKCFLKMKDMESAVQYLRQAYNYNAKTPDDIQAREEAGKLLKTLGFTP